jgi:uncharacterized membrane protein YbhN (UPF0104 family)
MFGNVVRSEAEDSHAAPIAFLVTGKSSGYDVRKVEEANAIPSADEIGAGDSAGRDRGIDRRRTAAGAVLVLAVIGGAGYAISKERQTFVDTLRHVGVWPLAASFACGLIGIAATFPLWREVLDGLGVELPWGPAAQVFFVSQLGKYVPGSVWPVVMQMEAGRARNASRRTMFSANLITIVLNCCIGLIVACLLLPAYDIGAVTRYWWALAALPFLLALLHPRALPGILDRVFALLHRPPLDEHLDLRSELRASGWALLSWAGLGANVGILSLSVGHYGISAVILSTGGMALAVSLGVLFVPAPAGAGIRDVVLALVLTRIMTSGQALAVVVSSRAVLIACDVLLACMAVLARQLSPDSGRASA